MNYFLIFRSDGAIVQTQSTWATLDELGLAPGLEAIALEQPIDFKNALQFYVAAGKLVPKSDLYLSANKTDFVADGADAVTINGIPHGSVVFIKGAVAAGPEIVTDGELVITSTTPGAIHVLISFGAAYFDWSITINAT